MKKYLHEIALIQMPLSFISIIIVGFLFIMCGGIYMFNKDGCLTSDLVIGILCIILICALLSLLILGMFPLKMNLRRKSIALLIINAIIAVITIVLIIYLLAMSVLYVLLLVPTALISVNVLIVTASKLRRYEEDNE